MYYWIKETLADNTTLFEIFIHPVSPSQLMLSQGHVIIEYMSMINKRGMVG